MGRQAGQTLMEVLVTLVIVAVGLGYLQIVSSGAVEKGLDTASARQAQILARTKMEELILGMETGSSGDFEEFPGYTWSSNTEDEELTETVVITRLTLTVRYPLVNEREDSDFEEDFDDEGEKAGSTPGMYQLTTYLYLEEEQQ